MATIYELGVKMNKLLIMKDNEKYTPVKDGSGKEWSVNDVVEYYKQHFIAPQLSELRGSIQDAITAFENTTGIIVALVPVLEWDQAYQGGRELILKLHPHMATLFAH